MYFAPNAKVTALQEKLQVFMDQHIYPNERRFAEEVETGDRWQPTAVMEELKDKARAAGLWNLFLPDATDPRPRAVGARLRITGGDHRTQPEHRPASDQLLGAGHRQHGGTAPVRYP